MRKLYRPGNEMELVFIKSILEGEGILYYVHNDNFGSLKIGPQIDLFNARTILVDENDYDRAGELIADFLQNMDAEEDSADSARTWLDTLRMILEAVFFGWFVPGSRRKK